MEGLKSLSAPVQEAYQKVTYFRAIELYNDGKTDDALNLCNKSLKNPMNVDLQALALYLKGEILYNRASYDEAMQNYLRFSEFASPSLERKGVGSKFRADYNIGYCYFKEKNYRDAASYFRNAINDAASTVDTKGTATLLPDLYVRYADCEFVSKNYSKAIDAYGHIVERKWNNADYAQYRKGIILGLENKPDEKIDVMDNLVRQFPTSTYCDQAYYETGETYLANGDNLPPGMLIKT